MGKKKSHKREETGGLQEAKLTVAEKEEKKVERQKELKKEKKQKEKKEGKRRNPFSFLKGMFSELRKVSWPSFGQTVAKTGVVIVVVLVFRLLVFGVDYGLMHLYRLLVGGLGGE